ncbi:hypothetical protein F2Q70_00003750 [Brassica cretica]|uniref:Uncharacterized protein n=2 Tax=Brassica cretica TaxID=69181 RepID=A0A3N6RGW5_BRACR|nr:hypothetical protein F2Q68_00021057 [Brassica cretica]KAF2572740.1 hypothetical protein F2Q70_00003750 [Brassica cretica]KAF3569381.1 hypothetical protein DY000_02015656 [Brassica cretica]
MLNAGRLQLYLLAQAMIICSLAGILHANYIMSTNLPSVLTMCPLEQMTPINYRATCSQGHVPTRLCAHLGHVLTRPCDH